MLLNFFKYTGLRLVGFLVAVLALVLSGCGYHAVGHANRLPEGLHTIAIPAFINQTQTYHIEQLLTQDVVREFVGRTKYRVAVKALEAAEADATLKGTIVSTQAAPLTYDAQTGRVSTAFITLNLHIYLVDRSGRTLFENPNYIFREQYQVSREIASFFEESTPALQRMSRDFARTLVSDILEAY